MMRLHANALHATLTASLMLLDILLGSADIRAEQAAAAQMQHWPAENAAKDPSYEAYMIRMLVCGHQGDMELYLPQSIVFGTTSLAQALAQPVIGYYSLDLSTINKGKMLEPVKVSMTADGKTIIVNQYTRGLPPTRIPVGGGTVDFDQRFGKEAECGPFRSQDPDFRG